MQEERFKQILESEYSLDDYEYVDLEIRTDTKECPLCKKMFYPEGRNRSKQRYCRRTHVINCVICGAPIKQREASEKYGTVKFTCCKECANKAKITGAKATMQEKYGTENPLDVKEFREKANRSLKAKAKQTAQKVQATLNERYGGIGTASPILREKIEKTMMEKYGVKNPNDSPLLREKQSQAQKRPEVIAKHINTSRRKYGSDYPTQSEEIQSIMKETLMRNYGVEYSGQIPESREKAAQTCLRIYGVTAGFNLPESREKARQSLIEHRTGRASKINQKFVELLKSRGFDNIEEDLYIESRFYDVALTDKRIAIEIDPSYTHSTVPSHYGEAREPEYQLMKTEIAERNGYRCIHVFDWDRWENIVALVENKKPIYARKCKLVEIDLKTADAFINDNHIQGNARGAKYCYGLIYEGELVQVMTFSKSRYNKNYEWELLRLCTLQNKTVIGGASKLFKHFVKNIDPKSIISYCDRAKFSGRVYAQIGMNLHHISPPTKVWSKDDKYITDNLLRQRGYDQLFNANYGKGTSNEELMIKNGWLPVYDCGQLVFEWKQH